MGTWGTGIFDDDLAADVRGHYEELLMQSKSYEQAQQTIIDSYYPSCKDTEEEPVFWFALAICQWEHGQLTNYVRNSAIRMLESGIDLERWSAAGDDQNYKERFKVLEELKRNLNPNNRLI